MKVIRHLSKLHLIEKIALFHIFFVKFFDRMFTYGLKIFQKICSKIINFFKQSTFRKMSIIWLFLGICSLSALHTPSGLTSADWEQIAPYLIPETHPLYPALDEIFSGSERAIRSQETMKEAGFHVITKGHWSDTVIALHPKAPGFFFKLYTDDQIHVNELHRLLGRIHGALFAEKIVDRHEWNHLFKVPRKWLYLVPDDPNPQPGILSKRMVLVAEDMHILKRVDNYRKWKSSRLKKKLLKAVFQLLTEGGFSDSAFAFNLPFAHDGRIAIIDNDVYDRRPVPFNKLIRYLHPKLQKYAQELIDEAGPSVAY